MTWAFFVCLVIGVVSLALANKISPFFGSRPSDSSAAGMAMVPFLVGCLFSAVAGVLLVIMVVRAVW